MSNLMTIIQALINTARYKLATWRLRHDTKRIRRRMIVPTHRTTDGNTMTITVLNGEYPTPTD